MYRGDRSRKETLVEYGFRLPSALDNRPLTFDEFRSLQPQTVYISATPAEYELEEAGEYVVEQVVRPTGLLDPLIEVRPVSIQVDDVISEIEKRVKIHERVLVTTLTKRMAEELTDFMDKNGIRVRYLQSDIDIVERVQIIHDLRAGAFDVLVGINLLREGLDITEVSLVANPDADTEGFLRSSRSLIQTIGRCARNAHGLAILYADKVTDSMKTAIDETRRRREKQEKFNKQHGIVPKTIIKQIDDGIADQSLPARTASGRKKTKIKDEIFNSRVLEQTPAEISREIAALEKKMRQLASELRFEEAAAVRDTISALNRKLLMM